MSLEDKSLILRAQAGDKRAFAELMRRYGERVMNQALRFTRNIK
ncbi:MAG: RNA polymerase subunit sigma-24, partial [Candidatus Neomarinimicrobiota bacterium]